MQKDSWPLFHRSYVRIADVSTSNPLVTLKGRLRRVRFQSTAIFMDLDDGSTPKPFQLVLSNGDVRKEVEKDLSVDAVVSAMGMIVTSPAKGQPLELAVQTLEVIGKVADSKTHLPCLRSVSLETWRQHQHLRPRAAIIQSIFRVRSSLTTFISSWMAQNHVLHLDPNTLTTSACEGGAAVFTATTLVDDKSELKGEWNRGQGVSKAIEEIFADSKTVKADWSKDFASQRLYLTESAQLGLEALCHGIGDVYCFLRSYRAEKSRTKRHLGEFSHLEAELRFITLLSLQDFCQDLVQACVNHVLMDCQADLKELSKTNAGLLERLHALVNPDLAWERITYDQALERILQNKESILNTVDEKDRKDFTFPKWGDDLGAVCERYLSRERPVFVYNYPASLKSFYMKQNPDGKTVQGCDLLIGGLELIGSSIREERYDVLCKTMKDRGMDPKPLEWYVDLRKNGTCPTGGFGLGLERLVSLCTLTDGSVRDVIPFPVAYQDCQL